MKCLTTTVLFSLVYLAGHHMETAYPANTPHEGKIRALILTGGHDLQNEPFYAMFDAMDDVTIAKAQLPSEADLLHPELANQYDILVFYDMCSGFTPKQYTQFKALLDSGIGVVALHHTLAAHQDWPEYEQIIGGKYFIKPRTVNGRTVPSSTCQHDVEMSVRVTETAHPITQGLKNFTIHDEAYKNYSTDPQVMVLLTTDNPESDRELAWVKNYGKSRVFTLLLGHDKFAYENPNYRTLVARSIRWAASRLGEPQSQ